MVVISERAPSCAIGCWAYVGLTGDDGSDMSTSRLLAFPRTPLRRTSVVLSAVVLATTIGVVVPGGETQPASALSVDPVSLSGGLPTDHGGEVLIGEQPTYTFTASNPAPPGTRDLFNLTFRVVLPVDTAFVSASETVAAQIADQPNPGETTLIFDNIADLPLNSSYDLEVTLDTNPDFGGPGVGDDTLPVGSDFDVVTEVYANADPFFVADFDPVTGVVSDDPTGADTDNSYTGAASTIVRTSLVPFRVDRTPEGELLRGVHSAGSGGRSGTTGQLVTLEIENNPDYQASIVTLTDELSPHWEFLGCVDYYSPGDDNSTDVPLNGSAALDEEWAGSGPLADGPSGGGGCQTPATVDSVDAGNGDGTANTVVVWDAAALGGAATLIPGATLDVTYQAGVPMRQNTMTFTGPPGTAASLGHGRNLDNNSGPSTHEDGFVDNGADEIIGVGEPVAGSTVTLDATYSGTTVGPLSPVTETFGVEIEDIIVTKSTTGALFHGTNVAATLTVSTGEYRDFQDLQVRDLNPDGLCPQGTFLTDLTAEGVPDWQADCSSGTDSTIAAASVSFTSVRELADGRVELIWDHADHAALTSLPSDSSVVLTYQSTVRTDYRENLADSTPVLAGDEAVNRVQVIGPDFTISETDAAMDVEADGGDDADTTFAILENSFPTIDKRIAQRTGPVGDGASTTNLTCDLSYDTITWVDGTPSPGVLGYGPGDLVCFEVTADFPSNLDYDDTIVTDILPAGYNYVAGSAQRIDAGAHPSHPDPDTLNATTVNVAGQSIEFTLGSSGVVGNAGEQFRWVLGAVLGGPGENEAGDIRANLEKLWHQNTVGQVFQYRDEAMAEWTEPQVDIVKGVATITSVAPAVAIGVDQGPDADGSGTGAMAPTTVQSDAVVEFRLDLWNDGNKDAVDVEVWDLLPAGFTCAEVSGISDSGSCVGDGSGANPYRIVWPSTGISVIAEYERAVPTSGSTGSTVLRYSITVFSDVSSSESFVNTAGVRKYEAVINGFDDGDPGTNDSRHVYWPSNNIDATASAPTPNTDRADDQSQLVTVDAGLEKRQQSGIGEGGNGRNASVSTARDDVTIGEVVQYEVELTIPEGTSVENGVLTDVLPTELVMHTGNAWIGGSVVSTSTQVTSVPANAFDSWVVSTPSTGSNGTVTVTQPVGVYTNAEGSGDDTLTLSLWVRVDDQPGTVSGDVISNQATFDWDDSFGGTQPQLPTPVRELDVVEPDPTVTKTHTTPAGSAVAPGGTIVWNVRVANGAAGATLHDVVVTDNLPAGVTAVNTSGATTDSGDPETLTWTSTEVGALASLAPGAFVDLAVEVTVDDPATVSLEVRNDADLQGDGLAVSDPGGPGRSYAAADFDTLDLPALTATKDIEPFGASDQSGVAVGEVVQFVATLTLPNDTIGFDTTMFDALPSQVTFDSFGNADLGPTPIIGAECREYASGSTSSLVASEIETFVDPGGTPNTLAWFVGDIQAVGGDCTIELPYTVHVNNTAVTSDTLTNTARLRWNTTDDVPAMAPSTLPAGFDEPSDPWDGTDTDQNESVGVIEPQLAIDKDVAFASGGTLGGPPCDVTPGNSGDADGDPADGCDTELGATLRYTIVIGNTGDGDAHDLSFVDALPAELTPLAAPGGAPMSADGTVTGNSGSVLQWTQATRELTASVVGPLSAAGTVTYDYDVVLPNGSLVTDLDDYANTASVDLYFGLALAERGLNGDVPTYGNGVGATRGAAADDVVTVEAHTPDLAIVKSSGAGEDATDARLDSAFTWELTITNDELVAAAYDVDVVDVLPAGWTYDPFSTVIVTPYATIVGAGAEPSCVADSGACGDPSALNTETLTWTDVVSSAAQPFGDSINPAHQITIVFDAIPSGQVLATTGTTGSAVHRNSANVRGDDATGSASDAGGPYSATDDSDAAIRRGDLRLAKQIEEIGPHYFGQDVTYAITVTNDGPDAVTGVTVEDVLPASVALNGVGAGSDGTYVGDTWTIGGLANGASATLRLDVELRSIGVITNLASIDTSDQWDPDSVPGNGSTPASEDDTDDAVLTNTAGSIGDLVWFDIDGDGNFDVGEPGIPDIDIDVTYDLGAGPVQTTVTTGADGSWSVTGLPVDHAITVDVDEATLPDGMVITADPDGALDGSNVVTLADDTPVLDRDFAYAGVNSLGDEIWFDVDGGGEASPQVGDVPLVGVDVDVLWAGFDGVFGNADDVAFATATTDVSGVWNVGNLPDGAYRATVATGTLPYGIENAAFDRDGIGSNGVAELADLGVGTAPAVDDADMDFAYTATAGSLGDLVWLDTDADGTAGGEVGLAGATVTAVWANPDGTDVTYSTVTDGDGLYSFASLPFGDFTVTVDDSTLPGALAPTADADDPIGGGGAGTSHSSAVTLTSGLPVNIDQDFGYQGGNSIGDRIWIDVDGDADGLFDGNAMPIAGVTVTLDWVNPNSGSPEQRTTTTDINGFYFFGSLPDGDFTVTVDDATLPVGLTQNHDDDGLGTPHVSAITLAGAPDLDQDFSYVGTGTIGDTVWFDLTGDGVQDPGEPGFSGVQIDLIWAGGDGVLGDDPGTLGTDESLDDVTISTTTDANGGYLFERLPVTALVGDNYRVTVADGTLPGGLFGTHDDDDPAAGPVGPGTEHSSTARLTVSESDDLDQDFGYRGLGTVGDLVWLDLDASGTALADPAAAGLPAEPGVPGVGLNIVWTNPQGTDLSVLVTTDADGVYSLAGLPYGDVDVTVTSPPAGLVQTFGKDGVAPAASTTLDGVSSSDDTLDFSYRGTATLGDRVWYDVDGSAGAEPVGGVLDGDDQPLAGVDTFVDWDGFDGILGDDPMTIGVDESLDDLRFVATTDVTGAWVLTNLPDGDHLVDLDDTALPAGLTSVTWDRDGAVAPDGVAIVTLPVGGDVRDADVSVTGVGEIGDVVWLDLDVDGVQDTAPTGDDEVGVAGVDITVTWAGPTGPITVVTTTAADGSWGVDRLPLGVPISVTVDDTDLPGNVSPTHDVDDPAGGGSVATAHVATVTIDAGTPQRDDVDFGYVGAGRLGDAVWLDVDGDGADEPSIDDVMLEGVELTITWTDPINGGAPLVITRTTNDAGVYLADGLPDGDYSVTVDTGTLPLGVVATHDADGAAAPDTADGTSSLTLLDDVGTVGVNEAEDLGQDFAYTGTISVGDLVWYDVDGDGVLDDGTDGELELGLPDATVTIVWTDPVTGAVLTRTDVTDANGDYLFERLPAGEATVSIDLPSAPVGLVDTHDLDGGADGTSDLTLTAGGDRLDADFGVRQVTNVGLEKSSSGFFRVGETNSWTITVTNDGPAVASNVVVTDTLPAGVSFEAIGGANAADWSCVARPAPDAQTLDCTATSIAPDAVSVFTLDVDVAVEAVPAVTNSATVRTDTVDIDPADDTDSDLVDVPLSVLDMTKELTGDLYAGSEAIYRLSVRNAGPSPTRGQLSVVDELPADLQFVSASGDGWTCSAAGSTVTCSSGGVIPVSATAVVDVTVRVAGSAGSNVSNTATVTGGNDVSGTPLDPEELPGLIESIDDGLAAVIGVETGGGTVPDGVDGVDGNVLARTGTSAPALVFAGFAALLLGAALAAAAGRRVWWQITHTI